MKKHLLGILIFLLTFGTGFIFSPLRFSVFAVGSGYHGGFTSFESTDFVKLCLTREPYDSVQEADKAFEGHKMEYEEIAINGKHIDNIYRNVLISENNRILVFNRAESGYEGYCSIRKYKTRIFEICSKSRSHILEFEKQYFPE
jgi:hypothetical protein